MLLVPWQPLTNVICFRCPRTLPRHLWSVIIFDDEKPRQKFHLVFGATTPAAVGCSLPLLIPGPCTDDSNSLLLKTFATAAVHRVIHRVIPRMSWHSTVVSAYYPLKFINTQRPPSPTANLDAKILFVAQSDVHSRTAAAAAPR